MNYKQCELNKFDYNQIAWIPEKYAYEGRILNLEMLPGVWEDGWEVVYVYPSLRDQDAIERWRLIYKDFSVTLGE
jgi:hypothetical protein